MFARVKRWWQSRKRRKRGATLSPVLREFVYLDEVSVTSLLSSRLGALPDQYTETLSSSIKSEVNSSVGANAQAVKAKIGSRFEATQSSDSQVLRKATIQATFKDLCEYEKRENEGMVTPEACAGEPPSWSTILEQLASQTPDHVKQNWVLDSSRLARGELLELKVKLCADPTYRVSSIISTMADLVSNPHLAASINPDDLEEVRAINGILENLMAGLVPLKCQVVDYSVFSINGSECVVHRKLEAELPEEVKATRKPFFLVGVTEQSLYWKDIRRVLFSDSPVWVLCRVSVTGIQERWTPVKLVEVLREVLPDLGNEIDNFSSGALTALTEDRTSEDITEQRVRVLILYGELIAAQSGVVLDADARLQIEAVARANSGALISFTDSRRAFRLIVEEVESRFSISVDPSVAVSERGRAWQILGASPGGTIALPASATGAHATADERHLDSEFVAIYW